MKRLMTFIVSLFLLTPWAHAQTVTLSSDENQVTLLELYTSEGCSSCPPADRWLSTLQQHPKVWKTFVPIAFHVDYWNYLGWPDRFAKAQFSHRQREYVRQGHLRVPYTPGVMLNSKPWRGWRASSPSALEATGSPVGKLELAMADWELRGKFSPKLGHMTQSELTLHVSVVGFGFETAVEGGENSGRTLRHDFVALTYQTVDAVVEKNSFSWKLRVSRPAIRSEKLGVVAWVTRAGKMEVLQAVGGWVEE